MSSFDNVMCKVCECGDNEATLMLCDGCDSGFHTSCIGLSTVPFGDWFCRRCINLGVDKLASCLEKTEEEPAPTFKHVAYLRVSSKAQDAPQYGRVGLYTQNATILRWAAENQIILESTTCEVGSAYVNKPLDQLNKLINKIKRHTVICVFSVSRFSRNVAFAESMLWRLHEKGCHVFSVTEQVASTSDEFMQLVRQAEGEARAMSTRMQQVQERIKMEDRVVINQVQKIYNANKHNMTKTMLEIQRIQLKKRNKPINQKQVERWLKSTSNFVEFARDMSNALG